MQLCGSCCATAAALFAADVSAKSMLSIQQQQLLHCTMETFMQGCEPLWSRYVHAPHSHYRTSAVVDLSLLSTLRLTSLVLWRRRDGQSDVLADTLPRLTGLQALVLEEQTCGRLVYRDDGLPQRGELEFSSPARSMSAQTF